MKQDDILTYKFKG